MNITQRAIGALLAGGLLFAACGDDDDVTEDPTSEEMDDEMESEEMDDEMESEEMDDEEMDDEES